jgi:hypothetical protein
MTDADPELAASSQPQRWRSPLAIATVAGLLFALLSGSLLLFFMLAPATRDYWVLVHWVLAVLALVPYAVYQLRHYQRVRQHAQLTHYRVGLHSFFLICGTTLSGLLLVTVLRSGTLPYSVIDLLHIFFGYAFTLLISAHLTLVALRTMASSPIDEAGFAAASIRLLFSIASIVALGALAVTIAVR